MKKYPCFLMMLAMLASAPVSLYAQTSDGPPVNPAAVLATLKQIKEKQKADIKATESSLAQELMTTASSPTDALNYYINAVTAIQFNGLNHEAKEVQDWKKTREADFRNPTFREALCLHLKYLSLTLSHDAGVKTKDLLQNLLAYIQEVQANSTALAGQEEFMETPLGKSVIVRSRQIEQYVTDNETWELIPIKTDNMYSKIILPEYRLEKNANGIFQYWDDRIAREEAAVQNLRRPLEIDKFTNVTKPSLQWQRAEEYLGLGQKNNAINAMVSIITTNKYHPDAPAWIEEVEKLVNDSAAPATGAVPAPGSAPVVVSPGAATPAQN